jgi:hypothetical protein
MLVVVPAAAATAEAGDRFNLFGSEAAAEGFFPLAFFPLPPPLLLLPSVAAP